MTIRRGKDGRFISRSAFNRSRAAKRYWNDIWEIARAKKVAPKTARSIYREAIEKIKKPRREITRKKLLRQVKAIRGKVVYEDVEGELDFFLFRENAPDDLEERIGSAPSVATWIAKVQFSIFLPSEKTIFHGEIRFVAPSDDLDEWWRRHYSGGRQYLAAMQEAAREGKLDVFTEIAFERPKKGKSPAGLLRIFRISYEGGAE